MSHVIRASNSDRSITVARVTEALRRNWMQARLADRELMSLRTNLVRHVG